MVEIFAIKTNMSSYMYLCHDVISVWENFHDKYKYT